MTRRRSAVVRKEPVPVPDALTGEQVSVLAQLVAGSSQRDAAAVVGVAEETVSRWMHGDPLFVATLNAVRAEVWRSAADRLRGLVDVALSTVEEVMTTAETDALRLRAADLVLRSAARLGEPQGETDPVRLARRWAAGPWDFESIFE